jgi:hypothetical protein
MQMGSGGAKKWRDAGPCAAVTVAEGAALISRKQLSVFLISGTLRPIRIECMDTRPADAALGGKQTIAGIRVPNSMGRRRLLDREARSSRCHVHLR